MTADLLAGLRESYAQVLLSGIAGASPRLWAAFATVRREDFLPSPPWTLIGEGIGRGETNDPADLYGDVLVVLAADKNINNGSPSLHALMLHRLGARVGDRVLHVGAGTGYYTAILASIVGPRGQVTAVEFDAALAEAARDNLRPWPQVTVVHGDGARFPTAETDRIYVNFGLADPADAWLDHLAMDGVLILPLAAPPPGAPPPLNGRGTMLIVTRTPSGFAARTELRVGFVFAEGPTGGSAELREALWEAFARGGHERVRRFHRGRLPPGESWFSSDRFSLGLEPSGD
jgi:protein-L-isoaspartate(D-aspartate) O-methyltransferase